MNGDFSDIRRRQDRLEGHMAQLDAKVEREAGLRADMDNELGTISAKLNAHQRSLNALQEVQSDHTRRLTGIEGQLTGIDGRLGYIEGSLTGVEGRLGNVEGSLTGVEGRLGHVEADFVVVKGDLVTVKTGVHAILDRLDANLMKKSPKGRLAGRFMRRRDDGAGNG